MLKMNPKKAIVIFSLVANLASFSIAFAAPEDGTQGTERVKEKLEKLEERVKEGCEDIETRIAEKVTKFNGNKRKHISAYNNMLGRAKKFVEKLDEKGYDTSKVESDIKTLNEKIIKYARDYTTYNNKLIEAQNYACGKSHDEFVAKFAEAKEALKAVREDVIDIKNYYQNTLRVDLANIKNQAPKTPTT